MPDSLSCVYLSAEMDILDRHGNNEVANSPHFKSVNYPQLTQHIKENFIKHPDLQIYNGYNVLHYAY